MNIEYLDYFCKVAIAGSISKAAKESHISQSALSQQILKLEEKLGYKLLERSNKGVEVTDKGLIVLKYADNIIRTYNTMLQELKLDDESERKIIIEACWSIATYSLPCAMYEIKNKFGNYIYELNPNESDEIEQNILNNICDIGVIYNKPKNSNMSYYKIGKDKMVLVAPNNYEIQDEIDFEELTKHPFILLNDKVYVIDAINEKLSAIGSKIEELNILYNSESAESVKSSVLNGFGIGFLPYTSIKKELYSQQLKEIKIRDYSIEYDMYLIYNKNIKKDEVLYNFVEYFKKIAQRSLC